MFAAMRRYWYAILPLGLIAIAVGGWLGYRIAMALLINLDLENAAVKIVLPEKLVRPAQINEPIDIGLNGYISTVVPFAEDLKVPFTGEWDAIVEISAPIPIEFEVIYEGTLPVDTMAAITAKTELDFGNVKRLRNLEFSTSIPMKFDLPVKLRVPVRDTIQFNYRGPIKVYADEELNLRVVTQFEPTIFVNQQVTAPVNARFELDVDFPQTPLDAVITESTLNLRAATLRLERSED